MNKKYYFNFFLNFFRYFDNILSITFLSTPSNIAPNKINIKPGMSGIIRPIIPRNRKMTPIEVQKICDGLNFILIVK